MQLTLVYVLSSFLYRTEYLFTVYLSIDVTIIIIFVHVFCTRSENDYRLVLVLNPVDNHELFCILSETFCYHCFVF